MSTDKTTTRLRPTEELGCLGGWETFCLASLNIVIPLVNKAVRLMKLVRFLSWTLRRGWSFLVWVHSCQRHIYSRATQRDTHSKSSIAEEGRTALEQLNTFIVI